VGAEHLFAELARREEESPLTPHNDLFHPVRGRDRHDIARGVAAGKALDIAVRSLCGLRVDDKEIVPGIALLLVIFPPVGVKDRNQRIPGEALVVGQKIQEREPRTVDVLFRERAELGEGKNNIVAVDQKEVLPRRGGFLGVFPPLRECSPAQPPPPLTGQPFYFGRNT